jgi:hypothetical protein
MIIWSQPTDLVIFTTKEAWPSEGVPVPSTWNAISTCKGPSLICIKLISLGCVGYSGLPHQRYERDRLMAAMLGWEVGCLGRDGWPWSDERHRPLSLACPCLMCNITLCQGQGREWSCRDHMQLDHRSTLEFSKVRWGGNYDPTARKIIEMVYLLDTYLGKYMFVLLSFCYKVPRAWY